MYKLPDGFALPAGVKIENLAPDPGKRFGCYLDKTTGDVFALGVVLESDGSPEAPAPKASGKDITGTKVKFADGRRGVITEPGTAEDGFFARVLVEGEEIVVKDKTEVKPMTKAEIAAWDKEVEGLQ